MIKAPRFMMVGLAAYAAMIAGTASAAELNFSYTGAFTPLQLNADWIQSSVPIPTFSAAGNSTTVAASGSDIALLFGTTPVFSGAITAVTFNSAANGGGFNDGDFVFDTGVQLYSGSEAAPMFGTGVFALDNGTLTITAVPELATWTMMIVGFGAIGWAGRRRQQVRVVYA